MGHRHDWLEGFRGWLVPKFGVVTSFLEDVTGDRYYVKSETHNNQFVGRVNMCEEEFEKELHEMGFTRNPLSSWKRLESTQEAEEGSWRRIGYDDAPEMQLHTVIYDGEPIPNAETGMTYVYAHWELRWDVHPWGHYRGHRTSGPEGVRRMKKHLDENGIPYEPIRP